MSNVKRVASRYLLKQAGTFQYEGNTPLDMAYAMTDMLNAIKRQVPDILTVRQEAKVVQKALFKLEDAVRYALTHPA